MRYFFAAYIISVCLDIGHTTPVIHQAGGDLLLPDLDPHPGSHGGPVLSMQTVNYNGYAYAFSAYFVNDNPIIFQIWRPVGLLDANKERDFQLIYFLKVYPGPFNCRSEVILDKCVAVKPGDFAGLYGPVVPYSVGRYKQPSYFYYGYNGYHALVGNNIIPLVGEVKTFHNYDELDFMFSVKLLYVTGVTADDLSTMSLPEISLPLPACPALENTGIVGDVSTPNGQGSYVGSGSAVILGRFRYNGTLTSWKALFVNGNTVLFQIWRPLNHAESRYRLLKEYIYGGIANGLQTLDVGAPYPVQAGDHIGYLVPKNAHPDALSIRSGTVKRFSYSFWSSEQPIAGKPYDFNFVLLYGEVVLGATYLIDHKQSELCTQEFQVKSQTVAYNDPVSSPLERKTTPNVPILKTDVIPIAKDATSLINDVTSSSDRLSPSTIDNLQSGKLDIKTTPSTSSTGDMPQYVYIIIAVAIAFAITTALLIWFLISRLRKVTKAIHGQQTNTHQQLQGTYSNVSEYSVYAYINEQEMDIKEMCLKNSKEALQKMASYGYVSPVSTPLKRMTSENEYVYPVQPIKRSVSTDGYCTPKEVNKEEINVNKTGNISNVAPLSAPLPRQISENEYVKPPKLNQPIKSKENTDIYVNQQPESVKSEDDYVSLKREGP